MIPDVWNAVKNVIESVYSVLFGEIGYTEYEKNMKDRRDRLVEQIRRENLIIISL